MKTFLKSFCGTLSTSYLFYLVAFTLFYLNCVAINTRGNTFDMTLYLPILVDLKGALGGQDLILSSGQLIPFNFYRVGTFLYSLNPGSFMLVWYLLYQTFVVSTTGVIFLIFNRLTNSSGLAFLASIFILIADTRLGALNWSFVPVLSMVSRTPAQLLLFIAVYAVLCRKYFWASVLSGICFNIHPGYSALLIANIFIAFLYVEREFSFWQLIKFGCTYLLFSSPTLSQVLQSSEFSISSSQFFEIFEAFSYHAYSGYHIYEGVGFFLFLSSLALFDSYSFDKHEGRFIRAILISSVVLISLYVLNLYVLKNSTLVMMFLFRATVLCKLVFFIVLARSFVCNAKLSAIFVLFLFYLISQRFIYDYKPLLVCEFLVGCYFFWITDQKYKNFPTRQLGFAFVIGHFLVWLFYGFKGSESLFENLAILNISCGLIVLVFSVRQVLLTNCELNYTTPYSEICTRKIFLGLLGLGLTVLLRPMLAPDDNFKLFNIVEVAPFAKDAFEWIEQNTDEREMFAIAPDASNEWYFTFRAWSNRPLYVTIGDINQLAYHTPSFYEGYRRIQLLGLSVKGRLSFDFSKFYEKQVPEFLKLMREENISFLFLENGMIPDALETCEFEYKDKRFVIFSQVGLSHCVEEIEHHWH